MAQYSHRNGEVLFPAEPGFYFREHPITGELTTKHVTERDIEFGKFVDALPTTIHKVGGYYKYYGPIPEPERGADADSGVRSEV